MLDEHRHYLSDRVRVLAFDRALQQSVRPATVVLDLGSGTGILGLLACKHGARHVYSVDSGPIAELARANFRANGFEERATVLRGLSTRIELPERASLVVADQVGSFGFEAGILRFFADAHRRLLRPAAIAIPSRIDLCVAAVEVPAIASDVTFWTRRVRGLTFEPAAALARNSSHAALLVAANLLSGPLLAASLDTLTHGDSTISFAGTLEMSRPGTLHGIGGWFVARLAQGIDMTNSPLARRRVKRRNVVFPLTRPLRVAAGDVLEFAFDIRPREALVSWSASLLSGRAGRARARYRHSTLMGLLVSPMDLARTNPKGVPQLSPWGRARRTVLDLCDGRKTVARIEMEVFRRHPELFESPADAAAFAAEVVAGDAK